jgi:hypothetical protein
MIRWRRTAYVVAGGLAGAWAAVIYGLAISAPGFTSKVAFGAAMGAVFGAIWPERFRLPILAWMATVPFALLAWPLGAAAGLLVYCLFPAWDEVAVIGGFALACFLFVLFPALAVPSRRQTVASIALTVQIAAAIALRMYGAPVHWKLLTVILLSSTAALGLVHLWVRSARTAGSVSS